MSETTRRCTIEGCSGRHEARGYCGTHYRRLIRYGDPLYQAESKFSTPAGKCTVPGCGRRHDARGYCSSHYQRLLKHGDVRPEVPLGPCKQPTLPAAPLLAALERTAYAAALSDTDEKAIERARKTGRLRPHVADRLAVRLLGTHPALIYGDSWWLPDDEQDGEAA